jgi:hypothetical protein
MDTIFIKKIKGRFRVWLGSQEEKDPQPAKCDARFLNLDDAREYAEDWATRSYVHHVTMLSEVETCVS